MSETTIPRIAVTGMWSSRVHGMRFDGSAVAAKVLQAVVRAGGEPVMLFAQSNFTSIERLSGFDGLLVPGGLDVNPQRYGQDPHPATTVTDFAIQDEFESELMQAAIDEGIPLLAICRGFQLLNVMHGGSLIQDVAADSPHRNSIHGVRLAPDSTIAVLVGAEKIAVSSYHHQAVDTVGTGLIVTGVADDGIVEALEYPGKPVVAMQWHPEDNAHANPQQQALFDWLIKTAQTPKPPMLGRNFLQSWNKPDTKRRT